MFTSKDDLKLGYGVDMEIGKFLTDRKVPEGNLYWKKRLLYIVPMPGYLFIPLYMDMQFRLGLPKSELLSEQHLQLLENILHSAAKLESNAINFEEHIAECVALTRPQCKNPSFLQDLVYYFSGEKEKAAVTLGMPYQSLNRADAYLFSLCYFDFDHAVKKRLVAAWYALISYYLIVDDLEDIETDFEQQEENAVLEAGLSDQGAKAIEALIHQSYHVMNTVNPVIANRIDHKRQLVNVKAVIDAFLQKKGQLKA
ncbi:hypothetical protein [Agriterribacter sp.]|uniref:hypothetical protein n=1 Tax=Agriterribacter sp. TaxID=2821509 RepID=UPI002D0D3E46|nr:hypothetical protein [Agriterribacter sp.]HRO47749.1 hypothetical protein [Agriterribacter sp.]HRQ18365.1 hypothetical protein [Agriterribacter sp.]